MFFDHSEVLADFDGIISRKRLEKDQHHHRIVHCHETNVDRRANIRGRHLCISHQQATSKTQHEKQFRILSCLFFIHSMISVKHTVGFFDDLFFFVYLENKSTRRNLSSVFMLKG